MFMKFIHSKQILTLLLLIISSLLFPQQKNVLIKTYVSNVPAGSKIFITGNTDELGNWNFMREMEKESDSAWSYKVTADAGFSLQYKFTRGSWSTEAVDSMGIEFPNFNYIVKVDTTLKHKLNRWRDQLHHKIMITPERVTNKSGYIELIEGWKFKSGDDISWANTSLNDSDWIEVNPSLSIQTLDKINWNGNGWFRNRIYVDSSYQGTVFGLIFYSLGASEIYLDGTLIYKIGTVGNTKENEITRKDYYPKYIHFGKGQEHLIAVRYSNNLSEKMLDYGYPVGFTAIIMDLNSMLSQNTESVRQTTLFQFIFSSFILAFAVMHFLLFIFYPKSKENLFYSFSMLGFAIVIFAGPQVNFVDSFSKMVFVNMINTLSVQAAILFGLLTIYASTYDKMPKHYPGFVIVSSIFALQTIFFPQYDQKLNYVFYIYALAILIEMIRVVIRSIKNKDPWGWGWVIGAGFIVAMIIITYQVLILTGVIEQPLFGVRYVYVYGIVFLALTVSINLSKKVSDTNKNLEAQLIQVKELSEKTIEQERKAKEEEIARELLKADNVRKTKELDEARTLQLSMLPKKIPQNNNYDIAVYMKPASEVGGDYYDFKYDETGNLVIAVGDATGHGMKAGTMVATVKGLFTAEQTDINISKFLKKSNDVIKDMMLGNIFMAMLMVKLKGNKAVFSSAGMPPSLLFRKDKNETEEIRLKAMPLGSPIDLAYPESEVTLSSGDTILLMSDGFPELFNEHKEILGYDNAKNIFNKIASKQAKEIIDDLCLEVDKWRDNAKQEDDITFVVVKVK